MNNPASSRANYSNTWAHNNTCCICSIEGDADLAGLEDRQGQVGFCFWPIGSKKAKKIRWHHSSSSHFLSLMLLKACTVICREHCTAQGDNKGHAVYKLCVAVNTNHGIVCVCEKDKHPKHHSFINQRVTFVPFILGTQTSSAAHRRVTCDLALQICELSFLRASLQYRYYPTQPTVSGHYYYSTVSRWRWRWGEKQLCMFQSCPPGTKRGSSPLKVPRGTAENNK